MEGSIAFKGIIFDMDGTLVDSERALLDMWECAARDAGFGFSRELMITTIGTTFAETMRIMTEAYPDAPQMEIRRETSARFQALRAGGGLKLRPGVVETLEKAASLGLLIGLCTSSRDESAAKTLKSVGISHYFNATVFGSDVEKGKPDPEPYLLVAKRLGVSPSECYVIEDSPSGARSALAAGMTVAVVPDMVAVPEDVAERAAVYASLEEAFAGLMKLDQRE